VLKGHALFWCARQGALTWRWKSSTHAARGSVSGTTTVSIARWNRKEAEGAGLTNRKRIEAAQWGEQANICEARFLHGTLRRRSDRHKREGECAIPGEIWRSA